MTSLYARDIMFPRVSLNARDKGGELIKKLMINYPALPVVNDSMEVIGIVSDYDVLDALKEKRTIHEFSAESLMSCGHAEHGVCATPVTVAADTPIDDVVDILYKEDASIVPVVRDKKLIGLITRKSIITALAEQGFWPEHEFQRRAA